MCKRHLLGNHIGWFHLCGVSPALFLFQSEKGSIGQERTTQPVPRKTRVPPRSLSANLGVVSSCRPSWIVSSFISYKKKVDMYGRPEKEGLLCNKAVKKTSEGRKMLKRRFQEVSIVDSPRGE